MQDLFYIVYTTLHTCKPITTCDPIANLLQSSILLIPLHSESYIGDWILCVCPGIQMAKKGGGDLDMPMETLTQFSD